MRRVLVLAVATVVGAAGAGLASAAVRLSADGSPAAPPVSAPPVSAPPAAPTAAPATPPPAVTPIPAAPEPSPPAITPRAAPRATPHPLAAGTHHASPTATPHAGHPATAPGAPGRAPVGPQTTTATAVQRAMQAVLPNARVGFEVFDRKTGTVLTSHHADQRSAAMSQVKLLIALDVLARDNRAAPDSATKQQLHQLLAASDDQIANRLWSTGGGPAIVTRMVNRLGLTGTRPPGTPGEWGDTLITPQDMVTVYRYITDHLAKPDRDVILTALADTPKIAADGFDQHFGIPDGLPHTQRAVKEGWGTSGSQAVMNSTGLVGPDWRYVVVILAAAPVRSYSAVPAVVTAGARAVASLVSTPAS
ncbi:MAG: hypothetical protein ACRDS0_28610 [Pseudonocardiaceae bacterium]